MKFQLCSSWAKKKECCWRGWLEMQSAGVAPDFPNVKVLLLGTGKPTINSSNNNHFIYWAPFCR